MSAHGFLHHRRAAKALLRRKPTNVQVLEERFSPTAIFPGMTDIPDDPVTIFFPDNDDPRHGHGHQETTDILDPPVISTPPPPVITPTPTIPIVVPTTSTTSTSTPIVVVVPTTSPSSVILPTPSITARSSSVEVATVTIPVAASRSISSGIPSPSTSAPSSSSGVSTGAVVGGVGAGIVAVAVIGFAVAFFLRRVRKREGDEAAGFDPGEFRRSAMMLHDPPTHEDTIARGYNPPPPPSMMEKRQPDPVSASTWGYPQSLYTENTAGHGAYTQHYQYQGQHYPSMQPGQAFDSASPPVTATSAQPFITTNNAPYGQNPFSPVSPMQSPYEQPIVAPVLTRQTSNNSMHKQNVTASPEMTRQATIASYPTLTRQPSARSANIPSDDYVDLDRASVSPFQAAQYAEISRRLNVELPSLPKATSALSSPGLTSPAQLYATQQKDLPAPPPPTENEHTYFVAHTASPFADPEPSSPAAHSVASFSKDAPVQLAPAPVAVPPPTAAPAAFPATVAQPEALRSITLPQTPTLSVQAAHIPALSADSLSQEEFEFPIPPSPGYSYTSRYRVDSLPPTLPEIHLQERSSVSSYIPGSPMIGTGYISGLTDVSGMGSMGLQPLSARPEGKFVPVPSPLASSFVTTPHGQPESEFSQAQEKALKDNNTPANAQPVGSSVADSKDAKDKRPNTIYDPEDAYGGI